MPALALLSLALLAPVPQTVTFPKLHLEVDLSAFEGMSGEAVDQGHWLGSWQGTFDGAPLTLGVTAYDRTRFKSLRAPADVARVVLYNGSNRAREKDEFFEFTRSEPIVGPLGELPFGWFAVRERMEGTRVAQHQLFICGLTESWGYELEFESAEPLEASAIEAVKAWAAENVRYTGPLLDPNWTDEEADARFASDAPDAVLERMAKKRRSPLIHRTEHYIVFTDIGRGTLKGFAKALEENYDEVRSVFPFEEVPGERLMPVFYFTNSDDYHAWYVKNLGGKLESAKRSAGVASGDVYSTYHQAPKAPVHIHEQTHQLFRNRLHLGGGGSWFQEGVAEYMSARPGDLAEIKRLARKDDGLVPLEEFVMVPSLLMSSKKGSRIDGGSNASVAYDQAAAIVEFAKHSDFGREHFLDWVHAIGQVGRGDLPAIREATARVYGVGLAEFEAQFLEYWKNRRGVKDWHAPAREG